MCFLIKIGVLFIKHKNNNKEADRAPARARPAGARPVRAWAGARADFFIAC